MASAYFRVQRSIYCIIISIVWLEGVRLHTSSLDFGISLSSTRPIFLHKQVRSSSYGIYEPSDVLWCAGRHLLERY